MSSEQEPSSPRRRDAFDDAEETEGHFVHARRDVHAADQTDAIDEPQPQSTTQGERDAHDMLLLQQFWRTYDTIIILSICSVFGIMFRMMSATWFRMELGSVFSEDSALGTNLPMNILSCFMMGLLCSGREAMSIVHSKVLGGANPYGSGRGILEVGRGAYRGAIDAGRAGVNRVRGYGNVREGGDNIANSSSESFEEELPTDDEPASGLHRRRGNRTTETNSQRIESNHPERTSQPQSPPESSETIAGLLGLDDEFRISGSEDELREVQLQGLTRRIIASPCLVLFPAGKHDMDVLEHYDEQQPPRRPNAPDPQFDIGDFDDNDESDVDYGDIEMSEPSPSGESSGEAASSPARSVVSSRGAQRLPLPENSNGSNATIPSSPLRSMSNTSIEEQVDEIVNSVNAFRRIHLLEGWKEHTSPDDMKDILLLGLRVGFCGALSTFSSLNASVIALFKSGSVAEGLVGFALSIQLGIVSYRFGQHLAVYTFVWRRRREAKRDERRGYGLRLQRGDDTDEDETNQDPSLPTRRRRYIPSVRSIATFWFVAMFVTLCLAIFFIPSRQAYLCSLLFTPFGCLARWRLMTKYNKKLPGFPLGTFSCNLLSCALSGSLGSFLAGNPGPEESIVLTSVVAGFAGSLSSFATYVVEILQLIDPIIMKFDGIVYAIITIAWAIIIGYLGSQAKNWADEI